jgi:hypothetical protein
MARKKTERQALGLMASAAGAAEEKEDPKVVYWINEIEAAKKREKDFRKKGQEIIDIYEGKTPEQTPYNILFSNTETLLPAVYSAVPRPVVGRRFKDEDPIGKAGAVAGQRVLEFLLDTNVEGYETFDKAMRCATLDGLLPGRGITSLKYDAAFEEVATGSVDDEEADDTEVADPTEGESDQPEEYKASELVCTETRSWDRVFFGYAKKWSKMPWLAYEENIDREEAERLFGEAVAKKLVYTQQTEKKENDDDTGTGSGGDADERNQGERKTALIYQIWDKDGGKKIRYIAPQNNRMFLKVEDDPLGLTGFFNMPEPLKFVEKSNNLKVTALYVLYENQAAELNRLTRRINKIVEAIKARGVYDGELGDDLANIMEADDNQLVAAEKGASIAAEKGLQNAIWFMPIEQLVNVLMQLYQAREQCKRVIYEITGISDIIRGSSVASETATAQNIKSQWGTMRLKRLQKEVQRYSRDLLRMMLEVAATKFSEETWAKMTGLPFLTSDQKTQLDTVAAAVQQQMVQVQASGVPIPPQLQAEMQKIQMEMKKPVWSEVLAMLRDDTQRAYRIDIETNSTIEPEAAEDQKSISELMNALAQYLNGVGPLVQKGIMPFEAATSMLLAISRRFRFGTEVEEYIKQMQPPKPEGDGGAAEKLAAEKQQMQAAMQQQQKDAKAAEAAIMAKANEARLTADLEAERRMRALEKREADLALRELRIDVEEERLKIQETVVTDRLNAKEQIASTKQSARDTVQSVKEVGAKREAQIAQKADSSLSTGVQQMQSIVQQLAQIVADQASKNEDNIAKVVQAVTAPRRSKAVRDPVTGKIDETVSEVIR